MADAIDGISALGATVAAQSQAPWLEVHDELPRYPGFRPQTRGLDADGERWTKGATDAEQVQSSTSTGRGFGAAHGRAEF